MEEKKWPSAIPACNMTIGLLIFAQFPILFGQIPASGIVEALPWLLAAYPVILITVVIMYRNGDFVDATINAILSGVLMGQNFVRAGMGLAYSVAGKDVPTELAVCAYPIDGWAFLVGGIILLFAAYLAFHGSKMAGIGVLACAIGFIALSITNFGICNLLIVGGCGLGLIAVYLIYSGLVMLVNGAMQKEILPLK